MSFSKIWADEYNREIDTLLLENNKELIDKLAQMIAKASNITYETAKGPRLHNYLWCGVDLYIIKNNPENITSSLTKSLENINYNNIAKILGEFYEKDHEKIEVNLNKHFEHIKPKTFQSTEDFTKFLGAFLSPLKEGDNLSVEKGTELLDFIYKTFESDWEGVTSSVVHKVQKKMQPFLK